MISIPQNIIVSLQYLSCSDIYAKIIVIFLFRFRYRNYDNDAYSHSLNRSNVPTYQRPSPIAPSRKKNNESESSEDGVLV